MAKWETLFDAQDRRSTMSTIRTDNTSSIPRMYSPEAGRVIAEQIIQASDVSHTMQHFDTFNKWNERRYCEVLSAYKSGRHPQGEETAHPAVEWYDSQISFYDVYVIPLAERETRCKRSVLSSKRTSLPTWQGRISLGWQTLSVAAFFSLERKFTPQQWGALHPNVKNMQILHPNVNYSKFY